MTAIPEEPASADVMRAATNHCLGTAPPGFSDSHVVTREPALMKEGIPGPRRIPTAKQESAALRESGALLSMVLSEGLESNYGLALDKTSSGSSAQVIQYASENADSWKNSFSLPLDLEQTQEYLALLDLQWIQYQLKDEDEDSSSVAPYLPVKMDVLRNALAALGAMVGNLDKPILDLGSGDGRIAIEAAGHFNVSAVGYELDAALNVKAYKSAAVNGLDCKFYEQDFMADKSWAVPGKWGGIFVHIFPQGLDKLEQILLSLDCPIICINFTLPTACPTGGGAGWTIYNVKAQISPVSRGEGSSFFK